MPSWGDELGHGLLFAVFGAALALGRYRSGWPSGRSGHVLMASVGILYGVSDEWHQSFVPGRDPSAGDLVADTLGVVLGYSLATLLLHVNDGRGLEASPDV